MHRHATKICRHLLTGAATACLLIATTPAAARDTANFRIPAQALDGALRDFGVQSGITILVDADLTRGKRTQGYTAASDPETALRSLLRGTGLTYRRDGNVFVVMLAGPTAQGGPVEQQAAPEAEEIIVTAQKREERIQDVPIAISAFQREMLDAHKIEGGAELLRAVPNVNFSKSNFSGYNFSIRGIGTKAVSASTDPAVAVSFNNTPLIRNRLFEQEFLDIARVEVLRGPQGTLYGRNATGGVVNIIPQLPVYEFEGEVKGEVGSYKTRRLSGILNVPLSDTFAVRVAAGMTKRDGFDYNSFTGKRVNGRDLWMTRVSAQWEPSDSFKINAIWQHFEEDDDRSRTGKQLCTRDPGPTMIGDTPVPEGEARDRLSQACLPGSLYADKAFGVPNAASFPHVFAAGSIAGWGLDIPAFIPGDPYAGLTQSRDLREIATAYDPIFRANNDVFQLNLELGLNDGLTLVSQTAYSNDRYYSSQDYNRFISNPVFGDSTTPGGTDIFGDPLIGPGPAPGGVFTDPQLGPSDRMLSVDLSRSRNRQWTQEVRLQSAFSGPVNFNVGANYLDFKSRDDYYVFNNVFTLLAQYLYNRGFSLNPVDTKDCQPTGPDDTTADCIYVDPNAIGALDDLGHNYFLSRNPVRTKSWALFGEVYWEVADDVKITAGLRYTNDKKTATPTPSQLLLGTGMLMKLLTGGQTSIGYPTQPDIEQQWGKFTGRFVVDWKPRLSFTDDTLVYASYARGYKGGGTNPPRVDIDPTVVQYQPLAETFEPEYVNAFEIGTKNTLMGGKLTLNATAFYYDYQGYQVSQIVDRISLNENFDARSFGLELETVWRPSRNFRLDANFGYLNTRIADGAQSIDVMNRTQGNEDWVLVRPWVQVPSNCIAPREHVETILAANLPGTGVALAALCPGSNRLGTYNPDAPGLVPYYLIYGFEYDPLTEAPNGGRGIHADLGGNELPNSPRFTFNVGAQYTFFLDDWELTFRGDYYRQSKSYARVYNTEYDRLRAWDNANLSVTLTRPESDLTFQLYVKNLFNDTPITDAFTNSDDTGLTTNVFTLDPRIVGLNVTKRF